MSLAQERPSERDMHAMIDERLDQRRARELQEWLATDAFRDERFGGWKRGLDALRAAYDPILLETPPLYLSLAARASAAQVERAAAAAPPRPAESGAVRETLIALASFAVGASMALLLTSAAKHFVDPAHPSILAAAKDTVATIARLLSGAF